MSCENICRRWRRLDALKNPGRAGAAAAAAALRWSRAKRHEMFISPVAARKYFHGSLRPVAGLPGKHRGKRSLVVRNNLTHLRAVLA